VVAPHPINRLAAVAVGLRALAAELEDIEGEAPQNILWWASEIEDAIAELRTGHFVSEAATDERLSGSGSGTTG
jgi:hypothetical protein